MELLYEFFEILESDQQLNRNGSFEICKFRTFSIARCFSLQGFGYDWRLW